MFLYYGSFFMILQFLPVLNIRNCVQWDEKQPGLAYSFVCLIIPFFRAWEEIGNESHKAVSDHLAIIQYSQFMKTFCTLVNSKILEKKTGLLLFCKWI